MSILAIFANSPFDDEIRIDCDIVKTTTLKHGEICILPNFNNSIFDIRDTVVECIYGTNSRKIRLDGVGIIKFENNTLNCFGSFSEIKE